MDTERCVVDMSSWQAVLCAKKKKKVFFLVKSQEVGVGEGGGVFYGHLTTQQKICVYLEPTRGVVWMCGVVGGNKNCDCCDCFFLVALDFVQQ
jgi:hypothetical protein